jgi:hypothetical protein
VHDVDVDRLVNVITDWTWPLAPDPRSMVTDSPVVEQPGDADPEPLDVAVVAGGAAAVVESNDADEVVGGAVVVA